MGHAAATARHGLNSKKRKRDVLFIRDIPFFDHIAIMLRKDLVQ